MLKNITIGALMVIVAGLFTYVVLKNAVRTVPVENNAQKEISIDSPILHSVTSTDGKYQAVTYLNNPNKQKSYKLDPNFDMTSYGQYGDTVAIRNIQTGELLPVWQDKNDEFVKVNAMLFSADGTKLFFTTDAVFMYDFATKETKQITKSYGYGTPEISQATISPDNKSMIVTVSEYEAAEIFVVSIPDGKVMWDAGVIEAGGGDGMGLYGYISPGYILVLKNTLTPDQSTFFAYKTDGTLAKKITTIAPSVEIKEFDSEQYGKRSPQTLAVTLERSSGSLFNVFSDPDVIFIDRTTLERVKDYK